MIDYTNIPLFDNLSRVDIARLVPELEEIGLDEGEVLFSMGDAGDAMYIVQAGRVQAELDGPDGMTVLEVIGPGRVIGEVALLSGEPRMATIRAVEPSTLWRLSRAKLDELILKYPSFALYFNRLVGKRLANLGRRLGETKDALAALSDVTWQSLSPAARALLLRAAPLYALAPDLLVSLGEAECEQLIRELEAAGALDHAPDGRVRLKAALRVVAASAAREAMGDTAYQEWARNVGSRALTENDAVNAVEALLEGGAVDEAADILAERWREMEARTGPAQMAAWVTRAEPDGPTGVALWRAGGQAAERAGQTDIAVAHYEEALEAARRFNEPETIARSAEALATIHDRLGDARTAARYRASSASGRGVTPAATGGLDRIAVEVIERLRRGLKSPQVGRRAIGVLLGVLAGFGVWWLMPGMGLTPQAERLVVILASATVFWVMDVAPEFLTALGVCAAALLWGVETPAIALSGLTSSSVFLLFVIFGFIALVTRSGLSFRAALLGLRFFPATYLGQMWALGLSGVLATPIISGAPGRLSMVSPLVLAIKDTLRLPDVSRGAAGLALAAYTGYGQLSVLFLNGSATCLLVYGLLPPATAADVSWVSWVVSALPLTLVYFVGSMLVLQWRFRPETTPTMDLRVLRAQLTTLGQVGYQETLGLLALVLLLLIFVLQPWHGLEPAWLGIAMLILLSVLGADRSMYKVVDYSYLLYFAGFSSIAAMLRSTGADQAVIPVLQPALEALPSTPYFLLSVYTVIAYLLASLPGFPREPVMMIASIPLAESLGYHPLVFGLIILITNLPGLLPTLSAIHLLYRSSTEHRAFTFSQMQEFALYRAVLMWLGVVVSIPFWQVWGMIP